MKIYFAGPVAMETMKEKIQILAKFSSLRFIISYHCIIDGIFNHKKATEYFIHKAMEN